MCEAAVEADRPRGGVQDGVLGEGLGLEGYVHAEPVVPALELVPDLHFHIRVGDVVFITKPRRAT